MTSPTIHFYSSRFRDRVDSDNRKFVQNRDISLTTTTAGVSDKNKILYCFGVGSSYCAFRK